VISVERLLIYCEKLPDGYKEKSSRSSKSFRRRRRPLEYF
jgi:hypothetical protein